MKVAKYVVISFFTIAVVTISAFFVLRAAVEGNAVSCHFSNSEQAIEVAAREFRFYAKNYDELRDAEKTLDLDSFKELDNGVFSAVVLVTSSYNGNIETHEMIIASNCVQEIHKIK